MEHLFDPPICEAADAEAATRAELVARFAALVATEPDPADGRGMAVWLRERAEVQAQLDGLAVAVTAAFDASVVWAVDGSRSPASWLVERTGCSRSGAGAQLRTARLLRTMPHISAAARRGELCADQVRALTRARVEVVAEAFDAQEAQLVAAVRDLTVDATNVYLANWHLAALEALGRSDDDGEPPLPEVEADRLHLSAAIGGRGLLDGELCPESRAIAFGAIEAEIDRWHRDGLLVGDERSRSELQGAAFVDILRRNHVGGDQHGAPRPLLIGVFDVDTVAGRAARAGGGSMSDDGASEAGGRRVEPTGASPTMPSTRRCEIVGVGPVPVETIRRLLCEGDVCRVVTSGPSAPLDVRRKQRLATADQWRALIAVSGGTCEFGACETPAGRCHIHHIRPWEAGGPTDLANEMLVCTHHHRCLHEGGFTARPTRDGVEIRRRDGTALDVPFHTRIA